MICGGICAYSALVVVFTGGVGKNGSTVAVSGKKTIFLIGSMKWGFNLCFTSF